MTSATRTAEQTTTATFFSGSALAQYQAALRDQIIVRNLGIVDAARMFAAIDMSIADALISTWQAKYRYGFWRPIIAINLADTDGNSATTADPTWVPLVPIPPYPEYPSGYNVVNSVVTHALADLFHTDHLKLTLTSTALPDFRHYDSGNALRRDVVNARVWLGIHFRFAAGRPGHGPSAHDLDARGLLPAHRPLNASGAVAEPRGGRRARRRRIVARR